MTDTKKQQRPADARIAELQAKIECIKARDERKRARAKPEVKFAIAATKALDKALGATTDATLRTAFQEARTLVSAAIAIEGVAVAESTGGKPAKRRKSAAA
mgnify:CR=1 FL=1